MPHWKSLLDPTVFLGPQDFAKDKTVAISRVVREALPERDGSKTEGAMMYFAYKGAELPRKLKLPKSLMYGLSLTFGSDTDAWVGKEVTLYAARCLSFGEVEECVRIRFAPEVDDKIVRWLKKRKKDPRMYLIREQGGAS